MNAESVISRTLQTIVSGPLARLGHSSSQEAHIRGAPQFPMPLAQCCLLACTNWSPPHWPLSHMSHRMVPNAGTMLWMNKEAASQRDGGVAAKVFAASLSSLPAPASQSALRAPAQSTSTTPSAALATRTKE
mmetsp:Transcript_36060/g.81827  ORF Transcript_36060/g.81827 Transcript_36060/m.81827 type:complete len:132 (-) Transcript_36060:348-743(-)